MNRINLKYGSTLQKSMLENGVHPEYEGIWIAQEISGQDVLFERVNEERVNRITVWFKAIRAISLTATFMPALAVILWLNLMGVSVNVFNAVTSIVGVLLLQIAVNLFNDVGDYLKLIDLPSSLGGSGVIQKGWLTCNQVKHGAWICLIAGCILGLPALLMSPSGILFCGIMALIGVVSYSGKPFNLKYKALGDLTVFALCGPILTMGMSYSSTGELHQGVVLIGSFFGFAAAAILNANNMNDIEVDTSRGASTLASVFGYKFARKWQVAYYLAAYICLFLLWDISTVWILIPLLTVPLVLIQYKKLKATNNSSDPSLAEVRFDAAKLHLLMGLLLCVSLGVMINLA